MPPAGSSLFSRGADERSRLRQTSLGLLLGALVVAGGCCRVGAQPPPPASRWATRGQLPVPKGARITLEFDHPEYFLGENVLAHFVIENTGHTPFQISQGGDYRGSSRHLRFLVTATDEAGRSTEDPDPDPMRMGGLSNEPTIKPGERFIFSVPLVSYRKFDAPGKYSVRVSHDLGWKEHSAGHPLPGAEGTVTFRQPDPGQAEAVVARMESLPEEPDNPQGQRSSDYADFTALRQPVYLAPLLRRAEKNNVPALEGIGRMETPEATEALIELAGTNDPKFSLQAAQTLDSRLPDPQFEGKLPGRGPFDNSQLENRRQLSQRSWKDQFTPQVRALAARLLARSEQREVGTGAFMIEAVGTKEDAPAVLAAMVPATEKTNSPRQEPKDNILNDPEPLPELLRAMQALHGRGYTLGSGMSGNAEILFYFASLAGQKPPRAAEWQARFDAFGTRSPYAIREAALRSVPLPLPEACVPAVRSALADKDLGVCRVACDVAGKSGDKRFVAPLLEIIATENHEWVMRAATNAAVQLGAGFELQRTWADRLGDEHLYPQALDSLQEVLDVKTNGNSGRTDLSRTERLHLRDVWQDFLRRHEGELRAGKRFKLDDPAVKPELFGRARQLRLTDGSDWPPTPPADP